MKSVCSSLSPKHGFKKIGRETESVLQAHFYGNLMVKEYFSFQGEVCWLRRETYLRDIGGCREIIVLGTLLHKRVPQTVEIHADFCLEKEAVPQWQPRSDIVLYHTAPTSPAVEWTSERADPSELLETTKGSQKN